MQKVQVCPVCGKEEIPVDREQCPQCSADLTCFRALDTLAEREKAGYGGNKSALWLGIVVGLFLLLFIGGGVWMSWQNVQMARMLTDSQVRMAQILTDNQKRREEFTRSMEALIEKSRQEAKQEAERQTLPLTGTPEPGTPEPDRAVPVSPANGEENLQGVQEAYENLEPEKATRFPSPEKGAEDIRFLLYETTDYVTTDKDTLWGISERFYQSGRYYPVLMVMNPQVNIYEIKAGQRLKVLKNQQDVMAIFNRSVGWNELPAYFWYQVQAGDTLKTLSRKFYKTEDQYSAIQRVNPGLNLAPGQKIKILLPNFSQQEKP